MDLIRTQWLEPFLIETIEDGWETAPTTSGVYVIMCRKSVNRIGGTDCGGILYVGKSRILRNRLWQFKEANHPASGLLWDYPRIAQTVFGKHLVSKRDVYSFLGTLCAKVATPIEPRVLAMAEKAVLFCYLQRFGELPPLNFSLPGHWDYKVSKQHLRWAEQGIFKSI